MGTPLVACITRSVIIKRRLPIIKIFITPGFRSNKQFFHSTNVQSVCVTRTRVFGVLDDSRVPPLASHRRHYGRVKRTTRPCIQAF